jgi:SAM-dependent methyltransferase
MKSPFSNLWKRAMLKGIHYRDQYGRFDQLYRIQDPWKMESDAERFRFEKTNELIRSYIGPVNTLLEIGCGEGHQTSKFGEVSSSVFAIDISERAIKRARQRYPRATYGTGDIFTAPLLNSYAFDLVAACEVLYYIREVPRFLARMEQLGRFCLVTYVSVHHHKLAAVLAKIVDQHSAEFEYHGTRWHAVWWSTARNSDADTAGCI